MTDESLIRTSKPSEHMKLLFGLCFFHAVVIERKAFGPLGWNIPYEFNDTDLEISQAQLELYLGRYEQIPYEVLRQLTSVINYGGRITDDKDMRTSDIIINDYFRPEVLQPDHKLSSSGIYHTIEPNPDTPHHSYMVYIDTLPLTSEPEAFGMHDNAAITCAISDADEAFLTILSLQPRVGSGSGLSREAITTQIAREMEQQLPVPYDLEAVSVQFPTDYRESLNTVLVQEVQRYNNLLLAMRSTLRELQQALRGVVVLSNELEAMGDALFDQRVPALWQSKAYPSLKPLRAWFRDFLQRLEFITSWIASPPKAFWISGFFFPQGFLTAVLQNFARKYSIPIDTVTFGYRNLNEQLDKITERPTDGVYMHGLFLEGARWSSAEGSLVDPRPKELFSPMPVVHLLPEKDRTAPVSGIYRCPVYKILTRTGTLSTTGTQLPRACFSLFGVLLLKCCVVHDGKQATQPILSCGSRSRQPSRPSSDRRSSRRRTRK
jgi:dynein heavy chain